jgi:hypothetical protein
VNTGQFLSAGILRDPAGVIDIRAALPYDGNRGGLIEYLISEPEKFIDDVVSSPVNPNF